MVGLGIITYNRPDYFKQCIEAVIEQLIDVVDVIYYYNDGSTVPYDTSFISERLKGKNSKKKIIGETCFENKGVAAAKNWCLKQMMDAGCDYLFLMEDDIIVQSPDAIYNYIAASLDTGIHHFMFAHHGPGNKDGLRGRLKTAEFYTNCIGAFTMFTRRAIEEVGYFDEGFKNAVEHIEHTNRIARSGFHPPLNWGYADVVLSKQWLQEIPGSIDNSVIRPREDWMDNIIEGLEHWKAKEPDRFPFEIWLRALRLDAERMKNDKSTATE